MQTLTRELCRHLCRPLHEHYYVKLVLFYNEDVRQRWFRGHLRRLLGPIIRIIRLRNALGIISTLFDFFLLLQGKRMIFLSLT